MDCKRDWRLWVEKRGGINDPYGGMNFAPSYEVRYIPVNSKPDKYQAEVGSLPGANPPSGYKPVIEKGTRPVPSQEPSAMEKWWDGLRERTRYRPGDKPIGQETVDKISRGITGAVGAITAYLKQYGEEVARGNVAPPGQIAPWVPPKGAQGDLIGASQRVVDAGKIGWGVGKDPEVSAHAWSQLRSGLMDSAYGAVPGIVGLVSDDAANAITDWYDTTRFGRMRKDFEDIAARNEAAVNRRYDIDPRSEEYRIGKAVQQLGNTAVGVGMSWPLWGMLGRGISSASGVIKGFGAGTKFQTAANVASKVPPLAFAYKINKDMYDSGKESDAQVEDARKYKEELKEETENYKKDVIEGFIDRYLESGEIDNEYGKQLDALIEGGLLGPDDIQKIEDIRRRLVNDAVVRSSYRAWLPKGRADIISPIFDEGNERFANLVSDENLKLLAEAIADSKSRLLK